MVEPLPAIPQPRMAEIRLALCQEFRLTEMDLLSARRSAFLARPRQIGMYLARHMTQRSLPDIGRHFKRDHTTVICAIKKVEQLSASDTEFANTVGKVMGRVTAIMDQRERLAA